MDKLNCMKVFCCVVKEGSFTAAAKQLSTSKVLASRAVTQLESELGIRLLQRTTRKMSLTEDGAAYFERCLVLLEEFDDLDSAIKDSASTVKGKLRVSLPTEYFTTVHVLPFLIKFAQQYPALQLDIVMADRHVDVVEEGFDVALRMGVLEDSTLVGKKLANMELVLCASRSYLQNHSAIYSPEDVNQHSFIFDSNYRGGQRLTLNKQQQKSTISIKNRISVNNAVLTCEFIKQGLGIGLTPDFMIQQSVKSGEIIRLLPEWKISEGGIYVVYSHRKHLSAKVTSFVSSITSYFKQHYHSNC